MVSSNSRVVPSTLNTVPVEHATQTAPSPTATEPDARAMDLLEEAAGSLS
jgi:hypothetical protein